MKDLRVAAMALHYVWGVLVETRPHSEGLGLFVYLEPVCLLNRQVGMLSMHLRLSLIHI